MCLIFFALDHHPDYKLVVAANRDEFYARRTTPAHYWDDQPNLLAGRDLEAGGTWMGMSRKGNISLVTNYRDPAHIDPAAPSRGQLVSDYLASDVSPEQYLHGVSKNANAYNGFNLIVGNGNELWYLSNYRKGLEKIAPGFYGLSNHLLETPWPKVTRGKKIIAALLNEKVLRTEDFLNALYDDTRAADDALPDTGVGLERERMLSSMFIKSPVYGTRCSTVVLIDRNDHVTYTERVYRVTDFTFEEQTFAFSVGSSQ